MNHDKITVYTQVYNTKPYLDKCIYSVLNQTHSNVEYIVVDNGCTDGSSEIISDIANKDRRIKLIRHEENQRGFWPSLVQKEATGTYFAILDSDDWWEDCYLERMLEFMKNGNLDIACTGTCMHISSTNETVFRKMQQPMTISKQQYAMAFPFYHAFFRTTWNKLIKAEFIRAISEFPPIPYGMDTLYCFQLLRHAKRIGIDNSVLHHYRIHKKSVSYQYDKRRFDADVYLYNDALDFLAPYGPLSKRNKDFLGAVYANAVVDTVRVIRDAALPGGEKIAEYRRIAEHPITRDVYGTRQAEANNSRALLLQSIVREDCAGVEEDVRAALQALLPDCGALLEAPGRLGLFLREKELYAALLRDDAPALAEGLLGLIEARKWGKQYDLGGMLAALMPEDSPLRGVCDERFIRKYMQPYRMVLEGAYGEALDVMTDILLGGGKLYDGLCFLRLYLLLAAGLEQASAYLFGTIRLAALHLEEGRRTDCAAVLAELAQMGAEEHAEVVELRRRLEEGA